MAATSTSGRMATVSTQGPKKPDFHQLRELQREFLQLRWNAICARGDQAHYARSIDTHVVSHALGLRAATAPRTSTIQSTPETRLNFDHLPSYVDAPSPQISTAFVFADAASCGLLSRRRKFRDFGDGMISYDAKRGVAYHGEGVHAYHVRRLSVGLALAYAWLFLFLIVFWVYRNQTGQYARLTVPPYASGTIHLVLCISVVLTYALGSACVPRHTTVGMREGSLPSVLPLVLQTRYKQFMSSYAWSSRYLPLVRSLSVILTDCWLDVREMAPGDRVTQEIAHAAATVRCLVIFFSYEYLRSVNCTLECLVALRYRSAPQETIILLEALDEHAEQGVDRMERHVPLSAAEAREVADLLERAIPGLRVATNVPRLLELLDHHCVRAVTSAGIATTISWWAAHGRARVSRAASTIRVVPPILRSFAKNYWGFMCSCRPRRPGDVAGGSALLSGDGTAVRWHRPLDAATLTMLAVLGAEAVVYGHMFVYCSPTIEALTSTAPGFAGSCLPSSSFLHLTALLPLALVTLQYYVGMRPDAVHLHDEILLPLNVAAHSSGLRTVIDHAIAKAKRDRSPTFAAAIRTAFASFATPRAAAGRGYVPAPTRPPPYLSAAAASAMVAGDVDASDGFCIVFVTSDSPCPGFELVARNLCEFVTVRATGVRTSTVRISSLQPVAQPFTVYVFLLDSPAAVDVFYRRVHCAPIPRRRSVLLGGVGEPLTMSAYPTCQVVVVCEAGVLRSAARSMRGLVAPKRLQQRPQQALPLTSSGPVMRPVSHAFAGPPAPMPNSEARIDTVASPLAVAPNLKLHMHAVSRESPEGVTERYLTEGEVDDGAALDTHRVDSEAAPAVPTGRFAASASFEPGASQRPGASPPPESARPVPQRRLAFRKGRQPRSPTTPAVHAPHARSASPRAAQNAWPPFAKQQRRRKPEPVLAPADAVGLSEDGGGGRRDAEAPLLWQTPAHSAAFTAAVAPPILPGRLALGGLPLPATARITRRQLPPLSAQDAALRAQRRSLWARAIRAAAKQFPRYELDMETHGLAPPQPRDLAPSGPDGCLAPHLRAALFEYLLIVTGTKNGVDPSSPYQSLAQALLDSVCRKVGSVLQVGSAALAEDDE